MLTDEPAKKEIMRIFTTEFTVKGHSYYQIVDADFYCGF